ncbi:response regulator transcription factor [Pseudoteredinibacter isoporae]|uniref:DNA-binding NarL/FixJ family response regulator n=1 Tax=Pseudoteredinibacter isoporae TaxID=570281 RepID=A0A7X0JWT0_9GAMM|nr:response regulator transcription factor [Pseudoteredinibacter isoporae]MBB6523685.1 DNA-binding NarL/FixJ family response regulator [Pseudoteredinibacter isoporae]NHO89188.1 response regulator transcription factor [Pseudoteredinibacter isoporae]NIB22201.1 response regulator transcription factor [Pseudoteredinibacter isoporae]
MISIALVDDQALIREGVSRLLQLNEHFEMSWEASNGQEALDKLSEQPVDIIISDIRMPKMDGIAFVQALRDKGDNTAILMLTTFDEHQLFIQALRAGANGFLLKDVSLEKLHKAVETVAGGGFLAEPELLQNDALQSIDDEQLSRPLLLEELNDKERQILRYIAAGFSNKEIAGAVFLSEGTVKNHISTILQKMEARDRTQAVVKALRWKLLD